MTDNLDKIKTRIQALIAKAESSTHEAEQDTFMAKAMALLEEYQLSLGDLASEDDRVLRWFGSRRGTGPSAYRGRLQAQLATLYGCRVVWGYDSIIGDHRLNIVGPLSAQVTFELLEPFIWGQVVAVSKTTAKETGIAVGVVQRRVVNNLLIRISKMINTHRQAPKSGASTAHALVVTSAQDAIIKELFPQLKEGRPSKVKTGNDAIRNAASGISLNRQATGSTTLRIAR